MAIAHQDIDIDGPAHLDISHVYFLARTRIKHHAGGVGAVLQEVDILADFSDAGGKVNEATEKEDDAENQLGFPALFFQLCFPDSVFLLNGFLPGLRGAGVLCQKPEQGVCLWGVGKALADSAGVLQKEGSLSLDEKENRGAVAAPVPDLCQHVGLQRVFLHLRASAHNGAVVCEGVVGLRGGEEVPECADKLAERESQEKEIT